MNHDTAPPIARSVLDLTSFGTQVLGHMLETQARGFSDPDAPPPEVVFEELVGGVLEGLADRHPATDMRAAREVLADAVETLSSEIFMVPHDPHPRRGYRLPFPRRPE